MPTGFLAAVALVLAAGYAALTLPTGHLDPCRAVFARVLAEFPPPATHDPLSSAFAGAAEAAMFQRIAQSGPFACTGALIQHAAGQQITTLR